MKLLNQKLEIREMQAREAPLIVNYFHSSPPEYLLGMGADPAKLPEAEEWIRTIQWQCNTPFSRKDRYYLLWLLNSEPIGHCNINQIDFGNEAHMHLHVWNSSNRQRGLGLKFLRKAIPVYFEKFELKKLYCEPYALNPGPNKTLLRLGFQLVKKYRTTPGSINFEQEVNQYLLLRNEIYRWNQDR